MIDEPDEVVDIIKVKHMGPTWKCQNIGCYVSATWQTHKTLISLLALIYD